MGTVKGNWLTGAHSGSACRHEDIYTKVDKKTGKCYSVKVCNPFDGTASAAQTAHRTKFGQISSALASWLETNKESSASGYSAYKKVKAAYDRQTKCSTLRGYMMAKNMAEVVSDGVKITVGSYTATVTSSGTSSGGSTTYSINLTASPSEGGSVGSGQATATAGSTVRITATANSGYSFTKWSDNNTSATRDIVVNSDINLTAIFTLNGGGIEE